jgi:hypothetical protein
MNDFFRSLKSVFSKKVNVLLFLMFSFLFFYLLIMIPVWTTPGNDFLFQLELMGSFVVVMLGCLALLNGLLVVKQYYIWRFLKVSSSGVLSGAGGAFGALIVSVFTCAACYSSIIAFAGLGVSTFFIKYRLWILLIALILVIFALKKSSEQIAGKCDVCKVPKVQ